MIIRTPKSYDLKETSVTKEDIYFNRRKFLKSSLAAAGGVFLGFCPSKNLQAELQQLSYKTTKWGKTLKPSSFEAITSYNNFYEFGTDKSDPYANAGALTTDPWTVAVSGEAKKTGEFAFEDIVKGLTPEERIYRFRCVEAWSMVVPWMGIPLKDILQQFEPTGDAKYVVFKTLYRPEEMVGRRSFFSSIDWPYVEGLRLDEAYHPLSIMAVGLYGKELPNQNGAPWRLMVPWKYGFKSIKSIVSIHFSERQPINTWQALAAHEYGFYANVNPAVDHPRWSQASERRLPSSIFDPNRRPTLPFNGYAEEVAELYRGMDLRKFY